MYDLRFTGDDGAEYLLHGEKSVRLSAALSSVTTLATEVARARSRRSSSAPEGGS